jgi:hypothetical protein
MPKLSLDELDRIGRFMVISSMKTAIELENRGMNKENYMTWCSEIWDSIQKNDRETLHSILHNAIEDDIQDFIKSARG